MKSKNKFFYTLLALGFLLGGTTRTLTNNDVNITSKYNEIYHVDGEAEITNILADITDSQWEEATGSFNSLTIEIHNDAGSGILGEELNIDIISSDGLNVYHGHHNVEGSGGHNFDWLIDLGEEVNGLKPDIYTVKISNEHDGGHINSNVDWQDLPYEQEFIILALDKPEDAIPSKPSDDYKNANWNTELISKDLLITEIKDNSRVDSVSFVLYDGSTELNSVEATTILLNNEYKASVDLSAGKKIEKNMLVEVKVDYGTHGVFEYNFMAFDFLGLQSWEITLIILGSLVGVGLIGFGAYYYLNKKKA